MEPMYYIGLNVHKKKISYCVKEYNGGLQVNSSLLNVVLHD